MDIGILVGSVVIALSRVRPAPEKIPNAGNQQEPTPAQQDQ